MNQKNDTFNPFDPTGVFKEMRDTSLDGWAKMVVQLVNTEAYAEATGSMLDAWLSSSGPFRKVIENSMAQSLANLNLPSRDDITRLADRMTNIEMRLDNLDAALDESLRAVRKNSSGKKSKNTGENK